MQIQDVVPLVISTIYLKQFTWNYKRNSQNPGIARKRGFWPWQDFLVVFILSELTMTHQIGWYTGGVFGTEHLTVLKTDVSHVTHSNARMDAFSRSGPWSYSRMFAGAQFSLFTPCKTRICPIFLWEVQTRKLRLFHVMQCTLFWFWTSYDF